jgi:hypothetical protein
MHEACLLFPPTQGVSMGVAWGQSLRFLFEIIMESQCCQFIRACNGLKEDFVALATDPNGAATPANSMRHGRKHGQYQERFLLLLLVPTGSDSSERYAAFVNIMTGHS